MHFAASLVAAIAAALLLPPAPARAAGVSGEDVAEIRTVIYRQIGALRQDRAREAFELASPQLRATYRSAAHFLREARELHAPLYRSSSVSFRALWILGEEIVQQVSVTDSTGASWSAFYPMERQKNGTWKTHAWRLVPTTLHSI
jgi:hypothetical protein